MRARTGAGIAIGWAVAGLLAACGQEPGPASLSDRVAASLAARTENRPPRILEVRLELEGEAVRARVEVEDPDADLVQLHYAWTRDGVAAGGGTQRLQLGEAARGERISLRVTATDGHADSEPVDTVFRIPNRRPRVEGLRIEPGAEIRAGEAVAVTPRGHDADGDALSFQFAWSVNAVPHAESGASFDTRDLRRGDVLEVAVTAHDGLEPSEPLVSPALRVANAPPRVTSRPASATQGAFRYRVVAEDPDGDTGLHFELADAPVGMQIDPRSGEILWIPGSDQWGAHRVRVLVDDGHGGRSVHAFGLEVPRTAGSLPAAPARD